MDMKDMTKASSRIYVGNLGESVDQDALFEHFKTYGKILGIKRRMKHSYAFVQFESDASAHEAIKNENQKLFAGRTLIVSPAVAGHTSFKPKEAGQSDGEIAPLMETKIAPAALSLDGFSDRSDHGPRQFRSERFPSRPHAGYRDRSPLGDSWQDRSAYDRFAPADPYQDVPPDRNDCEIIVVSKQLTEYAEYIEDRLKRIGLTVDVLYPNEDVPIGRVLGNILSRGSLYAILVMPQNEEHRSLTVNILHGLPQEHRNMPLEDSIALIARNYSELQHSGSTVGHEAIVALLHQVAGGRILTAHQYDRILEYVQDLRDKVKMEQGNSNSGTVDKTQVNLQQRIMSILNNEKESDGNQNRGGQPPVPGASQTPLDSSSDGYDNAAILREKIATMLNSATAGQGPAPQPVAAPNLKAAISNPTIQKALDTLINKMT